LLGKAGLFRRYDVSIGPPKGSSARLTARRAVKRGVSLVLGGRDPEKLNQLAAHKTRPIPPVDPRTNEIKY
jgi:short subunit dehydrogenase-like uncharacterized protein